MYCVVGALNPCTFGRSTLRGDATPSRGLPPGEYCAAEFFEKPRVSQTNTPNEANSVGYRRPDVLGPGPRFFRLDSRGIRAKQVTTRKNLTKNSKTKTNTNTKPRANNDVVKRASSVR